MGIPVNTSTVLITSDILALISEIGEFKGAWRALGQLAPEHLSNLKHVATIESVGSSTRIEGVKVCFPTRNILTKKHSKKQLINI